VELNREEYRAVAETLSQEKLSAEVDRLSKEIEAKKQVMLRMQQEFDAHHKAANDKYQAIDAEAKSCVENLELAKEALARRVSVFEEAEEPEECEPFLTHPETAPGGEKEQCQWTTPVLSKEYDEEFMKFAEYATNQYKLPRAKNGKVIKSKVILHCMYNGILLGGNARRIGDQQFLEELRDFNGGNQ
jgi:plasmid maintenance system antidote protein VapI